MKLKKKDPGCFNRSPRPYLYERYVEVWGAGGKPQGRRVVLATLAEVRFRISVPVNPNR